MLLVFGVSCERDGSFVQASDTLVERAQALINLHALLKTLVARSRHLARPLRTGQVHQILHTKGLGIGNGWNGAKGMGGAGRVGGGEEDMMRMHRPATWAYAASTLS